MKRYPFHRSSLALLLGLLLIGVSTAQTPTAPNEGSMLKRGSTLGTYDFSWWGKAGRTYFLQHSSNLTTWEYLTMIESGTDDLLIWDFLSNSTKFFVRLRYSDLPTSDPFNADFDGDKIGNYQELLNGTDPLHNTDTDGDGMPDDWEIANLLNPNDPNDAPLDPDQDGLTNLEEYQNNTNPNLADTDADGLSDGNEVHLYGTSPLNSDTDGDTLNDAAEITGGTDPNSKDSDGDGLDDAEDNEPTNATPALNASCWIWSGRATDEYGKTDETKITIDWDPSNLSGISNLTLQRADGSKGTWHNVETSALQNDTLDEDLEYSCLNYRYRFCGTLNSTGKKGASAEQLYVVPLIRALVVQRAYAIVDFPGITQYTTAFVPQKYLKQVTEFSYHSNFNSYSEKETFLADTTASYISLETEISRSDINSEQTESSTVADRSPTPSLPQGLKYLTGQSDSNAFFVFDISSGTLTVNATYNIDNTMDGINNFGS